MIIDSGIVTGSLQVSGSLTGTGSVNFDGPVTGHVFSGFTGSFGRAAASLHIVTTRSELSGSTVISGSLLYNGDTLITDTEFIAYSSSVSSSISNLSGSLSGNYLPLTGGTITGNLVVNGTASISYLNTVFESASVIYSSGSNVFGDASNDVQTLYGTVDLKNGPLQVTGSLNVAYGIIGNLTGTASYASYAAQALSSSEATLAEFAVSASSANNANNAITASYANYATTAGSASWAVQALTASYVANAISASHALNADTTLIAPYYVLTASYNADSSSFSTRMTNQENFSSSLDATFATDAQVNAATASLSSSLAISIAQNTATGSALVAASGSFSTRVSNLESWSSSLDTGFVTEAELNAATASLQAGVTASIAAFATTGSNTFTGNQTINKSNAELLITGDGSYGTVNFHSFNASIFDYVGQNHLRLQANSQISNKTNNFTVLDSNDNVKVSITGSLIQLSGSVSALSGFTGSLEGTASYAISSSYATTASYATSATVFPYTGSAIISGSLAVTGSQTITGSLDVAGNTTITGSLTTAGATQMSGSLNVTGSTILSGSLQVTGSHTITGSLDVAGNITTTGSLTTAGAVQISGSFNVTGSTILSGSLQVTGSQTITGSLDVAGNITTTGSLTTAGAVQISGSLNVTGSTVLSGSLQTTGSQTITGSLDVVGNTTMTGSLVTAGAVQMSGSLNVTGSTILSGSLNVVGNTNITGSLVLGDGGVTGSIQATNGVISSSLQLAEAGFAITSSNTFTGTQYISDTTDATSFTSTAALYTDGGLRVSKNAYVSGTIYVNNITVYGTSSVQYTTSSQADFGTNIINVNTATPVIRFGGYSVFDSGSTGTGLSGSLLWDSQEDRWIYTTPSGSAEGYNSAILIAGPRNTGSLGNESGLTTGKIAVAVGDDHIGDSIMNQDGSALYVTGSLSTTDTITVSNSGGTGIVNATGAAGGDYRIGGTSIFNSTTNSLPKKNASNRYSDSIISDDGSTASIAGSVNLTGAGGQVYKISGTNILNATSTYIPKQTVQGRLVDSIMSDNGTTVSVAGGLSASSLTGSLNGSDLVASSVPNTALVNSAITINGSSVSLGSSTTVTATATNALTIGTGLSGTSYNGSTSVTIANTGVTSITAGTGISRDVSTGGVTITNTGVTSNVAGTGISVSGATGAVTITNTGVTSAVAGTGVGVSAGTGAVTISIGQAVATSSNVQFNSLGVGTAGSGTTGEIRATADVTAYYSSDERLKENVTPIENPIEKLMAINGVTFDWKEGFEDVHSHKGADTGVIAQQIEAIGLPDTVTTRENGYKAVRYEKLNALLIEGFKVQQTLIHSQQSQIDELKTLVNQLLNK